MSVIYKNGKYYGQEGGGSASFPPGGDAGQALIKNSSTDDDVKWGNPEEGRAKSSAIAPVFDEETTYAEGDRVTYEDELYVFNKAHTGAWDSADADKSDVDSEIPDAMSASDLEDVKDAFSGMNKGAPLRMMNYSTDEQVVGTWIDGKPLYQKTLIQTGGISSNTCYFVSELSALNIDVIIKDSIFFKLPNNVIRSEYSSGDIDYISALVTNGNVYTLIKGNTVNEMYLTIQYTKTTD